MVLMAKKKDPAAVSLGKKGGRARTEQMTAEQRKEIARKGAATRWQTGRAAPAKKEPA